MTNSSFEIDPAEDGSVTLLSEVAASSSGMQTFPFDMHVRR
jgi:hypothetical protein